MSLLQPACVDQSAAKIGLYGPQGAGKTLTSILLAIGVSKHLHNHAPIAMLDTDHGANFIEGICRAEGVPLLVSSSRSFVDMRSALTEAEQAEACVYLVDSYSVPYRELVDALRVKLGFVGRNIPFQHREEIKAVWDAWVSQMLAAPLHCILAGRLAFTWDEAEDEAGDPRLVKLGTRMRGEGDAGYEPNLLIELEAIQDIAARAKRTRAKTGSFVHYAHVVKDRWMTLNGRTFAFKDLNSYKPGDYLKVWESFKPHFDKLAPVNSSFVTILDRAQRSSADLFEKPNGESAWQDRARRVTVACEELGATLEILWPGQAAAAKLCKTAAIEALFGTRSWAAVEHLTAEAVESGSQTLRTCERVLVDGHEAIPTDRAAVIAFILAVREQMREAEVM